MLRPTFRHVELSYGCHAGGWRLPDAERPIVIAGPNGSGKTTLVEGLVDTVFGTEPDRRPNGDVAARTPWGSDAAWGVVQIDRGEERFEIRRDFASGRVTVRSTDDGVVHFEGSGDPAGGSREARRYRQILGEIMGIKELDAYHATLFVRQSGLLETAFGEHLLAVAAGGHAMVDAARREIAEAHRAVTSRPIHSTAVAAINPRELERVEEKIASLRARLEAARDAGARRGPLALERDRTAERLDAVGAEIERLENIHAALARGGAIEIRARQLRELKRTLEGEATTVRSTAARVTAARRRVEKLRSEGVYPPDFPERVARVELRWRDLDRLKGQPRPWTAVAAVVALAAAVALLYLGQEVAAAVVAAAGAGAAAVWGALRISAGQRRRALRAEIATGLANVPESASLAPDTRDRALARYAAQQRAAQEYDQSRVRLAHAIRSARRLRRQTAAPEPDEAESSAGESRSAAYRVADMLRAAVRATEDELRALGVELDRVGEASLSLPDGVVPTAEGVEEALQARRAERRRIEERLRTVGQELLERGAPAESLDAIEAAISGLEPRRDALLRKAEVLEAAHALIADAHDAFQETDQERLVSLVSARVERLTNGALGPVAVESELEDARVRVRDEMVPLRSPPLSFGEHHALLLGIRLGTADFLAGAGIIPPLILEEPFAHLDAERASALWDTLRRVSADCQVIVTTQDDLLLDYLGIEADIRLGAEPVRAAPRPRSVAHRRPGRPLRAHPGAPDPGSAPST